MTGTAEVIHGNALDLPIEDGTIDAVITSPPYFALRSYRDGDEHYGGQIGSEATPQEFLEALWAATREMVRVVKPGGSIFVNLGDKYAGSGGHNNAGLGTGNLGDDRMRSSTLSGGKKRALAAHKDGDVLAARRNAPDRYNQDSGGIPAKSLMGLPWRYALGCIDQLGLILRAEIIWSKPNGLPESVTDRVRRSHETWFHLTKQGRYYAAVDEIREAHRTNSFVSKADRHRYVDAAAGAINGGTDGKEGQHPLGALPGSVWTVASEPLIIPEAVQAHYQLPDHFAAFPQEWPRRLILGWTPPGICTKCGEGRRPVVDKQLAGVWHDKPDADSRYLGERDSHQHNLYGVKTTFGSTEATITGYACLCDVPLAPTTPARVLDPFGGTGTVAMVARALGRHGISVDLSADYCRLARWRIFQSGHAAKTWDRTNGERQGVMF